MVRIYDNTQVRRDSLNAPYANAESFGGSIGRAIEQSGRFLSNTSDKVYEIAKDKKDEYDTNKVMELDTALSNFARKKLNEDIYLREGKNALGSSKEFQENFEKEVEALSDQVENNQQARLFYRFANKRRESYLNSTASFERAQFQRYKQDNTEATASNSIEEALANYTRDDLVEMSFNKGLAAVRANYIGQGELAVLKERQYKTSFYKPMVAKLSAEDAEKAEAYYLAHKDDIAASEHKAIEQMIYGDGKKQKSMKNADELWATGKSEREQLAEAYKIKNADERDLTIARIESRWADERRLQDQERKQKQQEVFDSFSRAETAEAARDIIQTVSDPQTREVLEKEYEYKFLGKSRVNDYEVYYNLKTLAAQDPTQFNKVNLFEMRPYLDDAKLDELIKLQTAPDNNASFKFRTRKQIVEQNLKAVGIKNDKEKALFFQRVEEIADAEGANTDEQVQNIVDRLLVRGEVLRGAWYKNDPNYRLFEVPSDELSKWEAFDIPDEERSKIIETLERRKIVPTEEKIRSLYNAKIKGSVQK